MERSDHDQRLKAAIKSEFSDVIDLMLPRWLPCFRFPELEWLEQELFETPPQGQRRAVDLVARIPTTEPVVTAADDAPAQACVGLVHLELEGQDPLHIMRQRMHNYRHELRRKFRLPVLPLCIYRHVGLRGSGWDEYRETFLGEPISTFRYCYLGLPALDGLQYIAGTNLLGVALAALMQIPEAARPKAKADALLKIASSNASNQRKYLLCECVDAYLPLEGVQMEEYEQMLVTPPYQLAQKYGKTFSERGMLKILREQLTDRFGPLSAVALQRLEALSEAELVDVGKRFYRVAKLSDLGLEDEATS
jgi:hypothetical protein